MKLLVMIFLCASPCFGQAWSGILDPSRATDWRSGVGFTIPAYTTPCATQPSLTAGSGNASANTTAINAAIASCDSTHNVVNVPAGTYYVAGISATKSSFVLRGVTPNSTYLYMTAGVACAADGGTNPANVCYIAPSFQANYGSNANLNPGGSNSCSWTAGYSQGTAQITISSCGFTPTANQVLVLDQADDTTDNGGVFLCSTFDSSVNCAQKGNASPANNDGRVVSGSQYSEQQETLITSVVSGSGTGPYVLNIAPAVYFNNIRSGQSPGAWVTTTTPLVHAGIENLTLDFSGNTSSADGVLVGGCYQCWERNVRSINGKGSMVYFVQSMQPVVRDSYFYGSQGVGSNAYSIRMLEVSGALKENNIIQNSPSPDINDAVTGSVSAYNFTPLVNNINYLQGMYASHNSGSAFNLLEGNVTTEFLGDDVWGTSDLITAFRNQAVGWQPGFTEQTFSFSLNSYVRGVNIIGNVLGQPGYHTQYEAYATSTTAGVYRLTNGGSTSAGSGTVNKSIYELGWSDNAGLGVCTTPPTCDALVWSTMMRWGNYDTVDGAPQWNSTEASPSSVDFINSNSTPGSHTLPASFYLTSRPTWFRNVPFPAIGPDIASGSEGRCTSGTYSGLWATVVGQCGGGTFSASDWGGFVNVIPAQDCFLNVMGGPPDGSGSVLAFDANTCYNNYVSPAGFFMARKD